MKERWIDIFEEYGEPHVFSKLTDEELKTFPENYPEMLSEYFESYGRSSLNSGIFQMCPPGEYTFIEDSVRKFLKDYDLGSFFMYAYSAFGVIYFWSIKYGHGRLEIIGNRVYYRNLFEITPQLHQNGIATPFFLGTQLGDSFDEDGEELYDRSLKKLGPLEYGQCYGFVPAVAFGGEQYLKNLQKVDAKAHFAILIQAQPMTIRKVVKLEN